jgi:organic hydroperoxide reductase OsmC/OhrA
MPVHKGPDCVGEEMSRFKKGEMHSGKGGKVVTNPKQAQAIALSACGQSKYAESLQSMGYSEEVAAQVAEMLYAEGLASAAKPKKILAN